MQHVQLSVPKTVFEKSLIYFQFMCYTVRYGCQIQVLPYKSHAPRDCFKKSDDCQTDSEDWFLCFHLAQQPEETLAVLYEISPTVTLKRGEKSRRNKDLSKFLEIEIPLLKSVNFCFTLITFGRWSAMRELLHHSEISLLQCGNL